MEVHSHAHVEHKKSGHHFLDLIISLCALVISAASIFMAYHTGRTMEQLVHANSWPFVQLVSGNTRDGTRALTFTLHNAGVGPARIHSFEYLVGKTRIGDGYLLERIADACCPEAVKAALARTGGDKSSVVANTMSSPVANSFLPPREKQGALMWPRTEENAALFEAVDRARQEGRIRMRACYCSVFDECWVTETFVFPPRPVPSCADGLPAP